MKAIVCTAFMLLPIAVVAEEVDELCTDGNAVPTAVYLQELQKAVARVQSVYCEKRGTDEVIWAFRAMLARNGDWFEDYGGFEVTEDYEEPLGYVADRLAAEPQTVPAVQSAPGGKSITVDSLAFVAKDPAKCPNQDDEDPCQRVLKEFRDLYLTAHKFLAVAPRRAFKETLIEYDGEWKSFLETGRGMTLLEAWINGSIYKAREKREGDRFLLPPDRQWVALHPVAVYEYLGGADDGQQSRAGVALDLVGVNWWRQGKWYLPSGGAISTIYSDRQGTDDWGYGVSLYFRSVYTVGVSTRSGDTGVFVSVDLLKLVQDNQAVLKWFK